MSNLPRGKNADYWEGYNEEAARSALKDRARAALDAHPYLPDIVNEAARQVEKETARKQRILACNPHLAYSMDAEQLGQASSRELATRELKELGIDCGDNDPVAMLDAHHAGRAYARDGGRAPGGMDSAGNSAISDTLAKYFEES